MSEIASIHTCKLPSSYYLYVLVKSAMQHQCNIYLINLASMFPMDIDSFMNFNLHFI